MKASDPRSPQTTAIYRLLFLLIVLVSGFIYAPALTGSPIWDDNLLLYGTGVRLAHSLKECFTVPLIGTTYFRPIVAISFYWDRILFGGVPIHSHLVNVVLHMAGVAGLICLLRLAFSSDAIALLGGFLFAVQPAQVMTVAWIGGRTDSLCALWFVLFAWALIASAKAEGQQRIILQIGALTAYTLAVFTREQAALSIVLVPLAYRWFSANRRTTWKLTIPYAFVIAVFVVSWLSLQKPDPASARSLPEMAAFFGRSLAYYFLLVVLPSPIWLHTFTLDSLISYGIWSILLGFLCAGLLVGLILSYRRHPAVAWFALAAFVLLLPILNLVKAPVLLVTPYRADTAGACMAAILAWGIMRTPVHYFARAAITLALGTYYIGLTWWAVHQWKDDVTFNSNVARLDPHFYMARRNLALALEKDNRFAEAGALFERIVRDLFPADWESQEGILTALRTDPRIEQQIDQNKSNAIPTNVWLGNMYAEMGQAMRDAHNVEKANRSAAISVALDAGNCLGNLGMAAKYKDERNWEKARESLQAAIAAQPSLATSHIQLGEVYMQQHQWRLAADEFSKVTAQHPQLALGHTSLAEAKIRLGDIAGARESLLRALKCPFSEKAAIQSRFEELDKSSPRNLQH